MTFEEWYQKNALRGYALKDAFEAGVHSSGEWIYCEDRLPEKSAKYMVCFSNGSIHVSYFRTTKEDDMEVWDITVFYAGETLKPYAWMSLPEPAQVRK